MDKTWLQVEMEETKRLFRKKLEELNDTEPDHLDCEDVRMMKEIYTTLKMLKDWG